VYGEGGIERGDCVRIVRGVVGEEVPFESSIPDGDPRIIPGCLGECLRDIVPSWCLSESFLCPRVPVIVYSSRIGAMVLVLEGC